MSERQGLQTYLFRIQTEGHCEAWIHDRLEPVVPGDLLMFGPGEPYELRVGIPAPPQGKIHSTDYFIMCQGPWLDEWWSERQAKSTKTYIGLDESWISLWRQIILEKRRIRDADSIIAEHLLRLLCLTLDRAIKERTTASPSSRSYVAYRLKHYVERHAIEPFTLEEAAESVDMSVSRASHLFKDTFGQSIIDYAIEVRLSLACERIRFSSMTLEQVAETTGFHSYSYFHRMFRARMGISPKRYREQMSLI
jgi:AraC family transcriptional regulator, arabinose operon regulatory protein